ncbi:MAG TPA: ATP-binding protein, partial [Azonexus sp.]
EQLSLDLPEDNVALPPATALAIYRIVQEALTNIRKHAAARRVHLSLHVAAGQLELVVADDGAGFRTGWVRGRHHGLSGMKHRVQMCAGDFAVTSQPGLGTRIVVHIPLPPAVESVPQPGAAART